MVKAALAAQIYHLSILDVVIPVGLTSNSNISNSHEFNFQIIWNFDIIDIVFRR
jgi:hypothetical protein